MKRIRGRERGQVMAIFLLFAAAVLLALWVMYDSGQIHIQKMRLQNTADNTAYSASVLMARDMNFVAYTNRAMVANQVAIAQAVGMSSWIHMMRRAARNLDHLGDYFWPIKPYTEGIAQGADAMADGVDRFAQAMIEASDWMVGVWSKAQVYFHFAATAAAVDLAKEVTRRNDPHARHLAAAGGVPLASVAAMAGWWDEQVGHRQHQVPGPDPDSHAGKLALKRFNEFETVVKKSRDPFSAGRSYSWVESPAPPPPGGPQFDIRKYGGSDLFRVLNESGNKYRWQWSGMDTVSIWARICKWDPDLDCGDYDDFLPLGWGAAHALDRGNDSDFFAYAEPKRHGYQGRRRRLWGAGAWENRTAARFGAEEGKCDDEWVGGCGNHQLTQIEGLRPFYDFKPDGAQDLGPPVTVLIAKDDTRLGTQKSWPGTVPGYRIPKAFETEAEGGAPKGQMAALAKAETYFARAYDMRSWRRPDRRFEHGNLYNPFWQVRLIEPTAQERAAAVAIAGGI